MSIVKQQSGNILVIHGSARVESDTRKYVEFTFSHTAHTYLDLNDYLVEAYNYDGLYPEADQFSEVMEIMLSHPIIVFATPVYWYAMSGKMKDLFDRLTDIITIDITMGKALQGKSISFLAVGDHMELPVGFEVPFRSTAGYLGLKYIDGIYFSSARPTDSSAAMSVKEEFISRINAS